MERTLKPLTEQANSSEATPVKKEGQLSAQSSDSQEDQSSIESSDGKNNPAPSGQSSPLRVDTTEEGRITVIVGAPPAVKGSASGLTSMQVERQLLTESSDNTNNDTQNEQSNPLRIDNTEEMLGKCIIIVGAPPPAK